MDTEKRRGAFISYSRSDSEFALDLAKELRAAGYPVWLDQLDIPTGARWDDEVEKALREHEIFLIILTPASASSENVKDEIGYAIDHGKHIMPVLLKYCDIPLRLRRFQYVDFTKVEFRDGVRRAKQLLETLAIDQSRPVVKINPNLDAQKFPNSHEPIARSSAVPRKFTGKTVGILTSVAVIIGTCIAAIAMISALGAWQNRSAPTAYVTPLDSGSGETIDVTPTAYIQVNPSATSHEPVVIPTSAPTPRIHNFSACKDPCNGSNATITFPSAITRIYLQWDYENIPYGAHYVRKWMMNGREWIKYDCTWTKSENGRDSVELTEPKGLHSGTWQLSIMVDNTVLINEQINISGDWDYWDPAGTLTSCYGTTN